MAFVMSHPDWEYRLKPLGATPDGVLIDDLAWSSWDIEMAEGLTMLMLGSQEYNSSEAYNNKPDLAAEEKAKSYNVFPFHQIRLSEYEIDLGYDELRELTIPGYLTLNTRQSLSGVFMAAVHTSRFVVDL